jgi:hypothetical protein
VEYIDRLLNCFSYLSGKIVRSGDLVLMKEIKKTRVAWAIVHKIISHNEENLALIMTHPCSEQYECLTIMKKDSESNWHSVFALNLLGSAISVKDNILQYDSGMKNSQIKKLAEKIVALAGLRWQGKRSLPGIEFIRELLSTEKGPKLQIANAWYDGSYSCGSTENAKTFPFYPLPYDQNMDVHLPWWTISYKDKMIAICNLETDVVITLSGIKYNLKAKKEMAALAVESLLLDCEFCEFNEIIENTRKLLDDYPEWQERYAHYAKDISSNINYIKSVREKFREWSPLRVYMNVTNAKNASTSVKFELRYLGQTVADLIYKQNENEYKLNTAKFDDKNNRDFDCKICLANVKWDGKEAKEFRKYFKNRKAVRKAENNKGNEEHRIESLLLSEFTKQKDKKIPNIKPVTIANLRFPMPTPLCASRHNHIKYSGVNGGGIDILARTGTGGRATNLCIIEVKDENTKKELAKVVMRQALNYATFIHKLLRSNSGQDWWKLFGFGGTIPKKLVLFAVCAMPSVENNDISFKEKELEIEGDLIKLHYLYFEEEQNIVTKIETSLQLELKLSDFSIAE